MRAAIVYVLQNFRKHLRAPAVIDPRSSGPWFGGWARTSERTTEPTPVSQPRSWLAREGWLRAGGHIRFEEAPAAPKNIARRERRREERAILIWHCLEPRAARQRGGALMSSAVAKMRSGPAEVTVVSSAEHENAIHLRHGSTKRRASMYPPPIRSSLVVGHRFRSI